MGDAAVVRKLSLEALNLLAENEAAAGDHPRNRCRKLVSQQLVLAVQCHEANPFRSPLGYSSHRRVTRSSNLGLVRWMYRSSATAAE